MRIAVVNWSNRRVGGVETYLNSVIPQLAERGHSISFLHEINKPIDRERIELPAGTPAWCVDDLGISGALGALRDWRPDLIYTHGLLKPNFEAATIKLAPSVFFAHNYYGTCISGAKTFKSPEVKPCNLQFGAKCLLHYFPHRCGGLNPLTMLNLYHRQSKRLSLLPGYKAIVTHSAHMRQEYLNHGMQPDKVHDLLYYVRNDQQKEVSSVKQPASANGNGTSGNSLRSDPWRLLFLGRMDFLKGGSIFLDSLPQILERLKIPVHVAFVGDGPYRRAWERKAKRLQSRHPSLEINFTGWLSGPALDSSLSDCDLLVLPSLWPEPFGLVGPELGLRGVPVAAFAVGGIPNWLIDGVNGYLAPGDPATASGLAESVIKCLRDPKTYEGLKREATRMAGRFEMKTHVDALMNVFEKVVE